jgi:hypothetical protein
MPTNANFLDSVKVEIRTFWHLSDMEQMGHSGHARGYPKSGAFERSRAKILSKIRVEKEREKWDRCKSRVPFAFSIDSLSCDEYTTEQ